VSQFLAGENEDRPLPVVFPAAAKYIQTVGFAFGELLRRFMEFLARPQTVLITCGYSYSDAHLNEMVLRALQNPTLHLIIFLPELRMASATDVDSRACSIWVQRIAATESPQVTLVGGGEDAYFAKLAALLPDPAIYDQQAIQIRDALRQLKAGSQEGARR
jgi:hypothetical protein